MTSAANTEDRPIHRRPGATRAARRRRAIVAELIATLGRQPDAAERTLIETAADLVLQREAIGKAVLRGETIDAAHSVKLAGAITRIITQLGRRATKRSTSIPSIRERLASAA